MNRKLACALAVGAMLFTQLARISAAEAEEGFQPLFNGKDLAGWEGNPQLWSVKDGAITGQTTPEHPAKGNTFLVSTKGDVADFELRLSYKITPNNDKGFANSGIQYRSKIFDKENWVVGGYQADMEAGTTYSGILYEERMTRGIMAARGEKVVWDKDCKKQVTGSLGKSEDIQAAIKPDGWNDYVVIAKGNHLQHFINGHQSVDVTDECETKAAKSGVLALQLHAGQPMTVQFKNIRIKTLAGGADSAADDLSKLQGAWDVASGELNGTAFAESDIPPITVTIKDKTYRVDRSGETDRGEISIDPSKQPKQMDIKPKSGDDEGQTLLAIYEVGADGFRVCYARAGAERPKAFSTEQDSGRLLITYKRKKQ